MVLSFIIYLIRVTLRYGIVANHIGDVMVIVLPSSVVDREFASQNYKIRICCFSAKHTQHSRYGPTRNRDDASGELPL